MAVNRLQAMLDRAAKVPEPAAETQPAVPAGAKRKPGRAATKLIGGHFAPEVSTQLRIIAAENSTTVQALLGEALGDLFVKKGKARIKGL